MRASVSPTVMVGRWLGHCKRLAYAFAHLAQPKQWVSIVWVSVELVLKKWSLPLPHRFVIPTKTNAVSEAEKSQ